MKFNMDESNSLTDESIAEIIPIIIKSIPRHVSCTVVFTRKTDGKSFTADTKAFINCVVSPFGYFNLDEEIENLNHITFYYSDDRGRKTIFFDKDFKNERWSMRMLTLNDKWSAASGCVSSIIVDDRMSVENIKSWLEKWSKKYKINISKLYIADAKKTNKLKQNWSYTITKDDLEVISITLKDALELKDNYNGEEALILVSSLEKAYYLVRNDIDCSKIHLLHSIREDYQEVINENLMLDKSDMEYLELINQSRKFIDVRNDPTEKFVDLNKYFKQMKIRALGYDKHTTREIAMFLSSFIKDNYKLAESLGDSKVIIKYLNGKEEISNIVDRFSYKNQYKIEDTYDDISSIYLSIKNVEVLIERTKKGFWDLKQTIN